LLCPLSGRRVRGATRVTVTAVRLGDWGARVALGLSEHGQ
jgi:hypothetical protein